MLSYFLCLISFKVAYLILAIVGEIIENFAVFDPSELPWQFQITQARSIFGKFYFEIHPVLARILSVVDAKICIIVIL